VLGCGNKHLAALPPAQQSKVHLSPPPPTAALRRLPEALLERIRDELTCCLCLDLTARPATLPCGHSACRACLDQLFSIGDFDDEQRCPSCRAPLPVGMPPLQLSATLKSLAELLLPGGSQSSMAVVRTAHSHLP